MTMTSVDSVKKVTEWKTPPHTPTLQQNKSPVERWGGWSAPTQSTEKNNYVKEMIAHAPGENVETIFKNHTVKFNKKLFIQVQGAAISVGVPGDVSGLLMTWWDRELRQMLARVASW